MGSGTSKDMAICVVLFNPAKTKRMIMNFLYTVNEFRRQGLPVFALELCFRDENPELVGVPTVRSNSYMFHKERLYRILEQQIPCKYNKLAFVDADIIFSSPDWYEKTSTLLNTYDVVQPFETCEWLDLTYTDVMVTRKTVLQMETPIWDWRFHPGFAWAFRRDWYQKVGFYDYAITGSGDTLSAAAWLGKTFPATFKSLPDSLRPSYNQFVSNPRPRITYLKGQTIRHLYHGSRENRKYVERHFILDGSPDIRTILYSNNDGVFEWKDPSQLNTKLLEYFEARKDDDLSSRGTELATLQRS